MTLNKMLRIKIFFTMWALLTLYLSLAYAEKLKLRQLNVVFRHGDRTPETFPERFPNDPHMKNSFYPFGSGGLTNEGKMRMYRLGKILRDGYDEFLGKDYAEDGRLFAVSSETSRTRMSLQLVLAALYPPFISAQARWHPLINWQPIPTEYYRFQNIFFNAEKCDLYLEELARIYNSTEVQEKLNELQSFLDTLQKMVGKKSLIQLDDISLLWNNLEIEKGMNLKMEPWMDEVLADERFLKLKMLFYELKMYNDFLRRLYIGTLIRRINEDMFKVLNQTKNFDQKILLYSAHDKHIVGLLRVFNLYEKSYFPQFSSALILELLSENDKYYVKVSHYLGIPEEIKTLTIPGCDTLCPLEQFLNLTKDSEILDEELNCKINMTSYFEDSNFELQIKL